MTARIPKKYRRAFERGEYARLRGLPEDAYQQHYTAADYVAAWRQGWESTDKQLNSASGGDGAGESEPGQVRRDRRDRWRLIVEVVVAVGAMASAVFFYWEIRHQKTIIQQQAAQLEHQARQVEQQQSQLEYEKADTLSVRRAQLLDTIYDQTCEPSTEEETRHSEEKNSTGDSPDPFDVFGIPKYAGPSSSPGELCRPRSTIRARSEAVKSLVRIERDRGVRVDLNRSDLRDADLHGVSLNGANLWNANLSASRLTKASLVGADLSFANLSGAHMEEADLRGARLIGTNLRGAILWDADLRRATLGSAFLSGSSLHGADLREADLMGLRGDDLDLSNVKLQGAIVFNADLRGTNLSQSQIDSTFGNQKTLLPDGLRRPTHWEKSGDRGRSPSGGTEL